MTRLTNWLGQVTSLIGFNLGTLPQRKGTALAAAVGIAGVVMVMVAVLSIAQGFRRTMTAAAAPDSAIVLRSGSNDEMSSLMTREDTRIVAEAPGVARDADGPILSSELFVIVDVPRKSSGTDANVPFRGVDAGAFAVRPDLRIVDGRRFEWGRNEVVVGRGAASSFAGLDVGSVVRWGQNEWTVVGIFSASGGIAESEIWTDAKVLAPAYQRGSTRQSLYAKLTSPAAFDEFAAALADDPRLTVKVMREVDYYAAQSQVLITLIKVLGYLIAGVMGLGAIFGALNTMYTAVSARVREIATLRALGFGASPVAISVLVESLVLAVLGGVVGGAAAWLAFDGYQAATMNWQTFSQVAFAFAVTSTLLVQGLLWSVAMGLFGGLLPAFRAVRLPVASALREL